MNITTTNVPAQGTDLEGTRYTATIDGIDVGYLLAHTSGLILNVEVDEDHQGEGIARALYEHADQAQGLYHVPTWGRTDDGEGFATAMGGDTMDDEEAATILDVDISFLYDNES